MLQSYKACCHSGGSEGQVHLQIELLGVLRGKIVESSGVFEKIVIYSTPNNYATYIHHSHFLVTLICQLAHHFSFFATNLMPNYPFFRMESPSNIIGNGLLQELQQEVSMIHQGLV